MKKQNSLKELYRSKLDPGPAPSELEAKIMGGPKTPKLKWSWNLLGFVIPGLALCFVAIVYLQTPTEAVLGQDVDLMVETSMEISEFSIDEHTLAYEDFDEVAMSEYEF